MNTNFDFENNIYHQYSAEIDERNVGKNDDNQQETEPELRTGLQG